MDKLQMTEQTTEQMGVANTPAEI